MATKREIREGRLGVPGRLAVLAGVAVAVCMPWLVEQHTLGELGAACYLTVAVAGMNLLVGLNGQISVGHSAFVGLGAYVVTILVSDHGLQYGAAMAAAVILAALSGAVAALPALRLKGLYVALASLGLALVFPMLIQAMDDVTGGTAGKTMSVPFHPPAGLGLDVAEWTYLVLLVCTAASLLLVRNIKHSRIGRAMRATRDQDHVAATFGVDVRFIRITVFAVSSGLAGLAGAMFAIQRQFVSPADFNLLFSIDLLVGMVISGATSVLGALAGGVFLQYAPDWAESIGLDAVLTPLVYGTILILFVLLFRGGVSGATAALAARFDRSDTAPDSRDRPTGEARDETSVQPDQEPDDSDSIPRSTASAKEQA